MNSGHRFSRMRRPLRWSQVPYACSITPTVDTHTPAAHSFRNQAHMMLGAIVVRTDNCRNLEVCLVRIPGAQDEMRVLTLAPTKGAYLIFPYLRRSIGSLRGFWEIIGSLRGCISQLST
jgi:hypothetical protein